MPDDPSPSGPRPPRIDGSVPHSARIWNYWMGGKDHYLVDREAGDRYAATFPGIVDMARASRTFLTRTVQYLVAEEGVRQFLDIGTGLPAADNTHQVAQRLAPRSRIVYVDNDPLVLVHARALLTSTPEGVTTYIHADLHDPGAILDEAARTLDLTRPTAVMLMGVLGHIADYDEARSIVRRLVDALPGGGFLVQRDGSLTDDTLKAAQQGYDGTGATPYALRTPEEMAGYYEGLQMVQPGLVPCLRWRPEPGPQPVKDVHLWGGVGRKP